MHEIKTLSPLEFHSYFIVAGAHNYAIVNATLNIVVERLVGFKQ